MLGACAAHEESDARGGQGSGSGRRTGWGGGARWWWRGASMVASGLTAARRLLLLAVAHVHVVDASLCEPRPLLQSAPATALVAAQVVHLAVVGDARRNHEEKVRKGRVRRQRGDREPLARAVALRDRGVAAMCTGHTDARLTRAPVACGVRDQGRRQRGEGAVTRFPMGVPIGRVRPPIGVVRPPQCALPTSNLPTSNLASGAGREAHSIQTRILLGSVSVLCAAIRLLMAATMASKSAFVGSG